MTGIQNYQEGFDVATLDLRAVFAEAVESKATAFDVLRKHGYPVFKFQTGGDGIEGRAIAGLVEAFEPDAQTGLLVPVSKAAIEAQSQPLLTLTASSNADDMSGDVMAESALNDMLATAKGSVVFLNHQYRLPEDVFGAVREATLIRRQLTNPLNQQSGDYLCLDYQVAPVSAEENPRAWQVYQMIAKGKMRLGASVTVLILQKQEQPDGKRTIQRVYHVETSMVGIPCNQTSWVHMAAKAANQRPFIPSGAATEIKVMPNETQAQATASKGMYADKVKAKQQKFWFMVDTLGDVINDLKSSAARKVQMDYAAELGEALTEFSAAVTDAVLPYLLSPPNDAGYGYYSLFDPRTGAFAVESITQKMLAGLAPAELEAAQKAGARNNKDDQARIQALHDTCCELGAKCMEKSADEGESKSALEAQDGVPALTDNAELASKAAGLEAEIAAKNAEITALQAQLAALQTERDQWKACSLTVGAQMAQVLDAPLPRAGHVAGV